MPATQFMVSPSSKLVSTGLIDPGESLSVVEDDDSYQVDDDDVASGIGSGDEYEELSPPRSPSPGIRTPQRLPLQVPKFVDGEEQLDEALKHNTLMSAKKTVNRGGKGSSKKSASKSEEVAGKIEEAMALSEPSQKKSSVYRKKSTLPGDVTLSTAKSLSNVNIRDPVVTNEEIEKELLAYGIRPEDKIFIKSTKGTQARFVKAVNQLGQTFLIEIDDNTFIAYQNESMTLVKTEHSGVVPYSYKMSTNACLDLGVCGVAMECEDGMCTVMRDGYNVTPREERFVTIEKQANRAALMENSPISYPIIRLSEIRANIQAVNRAVDRATKALEKMAFKYSSFNVSKASEQVDIFKKEFDRFFHNTNFVYNKLNETISELEKEEAKFAEKSKAGKLSGKEMELRNMVQYNLYARHRMLADLIQVMGRETDVLLRDLKREGGDLKGVNEMIKEQFQGVEKMMRP
jgi:mRNA-degrading endonuclease YafQ of YafQ-DinJ toxin-antitoxin module